MKIIEKDIFEAGPGVIAHQVNCHGVMGAGIAFQIKSKLPLAYVHYAEACADGPDGLLGKCQIVSVGNDRFVANLFGQRDYGSDSVQTDYAALEKALATAYKFADESECSLYIPWKIGCGLAGGDWDVVSEIIDRVAPNAIVCKLPD